MDVLTYLLKQPETAVAVFLVGFFMGLAVVVMLTRAAAK